MDSGASSHMTYKKEFLSEYQEFKEPEKVKLGDGRTVQAIGIRKVHIDMEFKISNKKRCVMHNVLFVPNLTCNLFSVRAAVAMGNSIKFGKYKCWIRNSHGALCGMDTLSNKLYQLDCTQVKVFSEHVNYSSTPEYKRIDLWHHRLGHLNEQQMKRIVQKELVTGPKFQRSEGLSFCEGERCIEVLSNRLVVDLYVRLKDSNSYTVMSAVRDVRKIYWRLLLLYYLR